MKKFSLSTMLAMVLAYAGFAQQTEAPDETPHAEILFEKTVHDFGAIEYSGNGTYEFQFSNTGTAPLLINSANTTCGCTVPSFSKAPIAPGEKGIITVKYDTTRQGAISKSITVNSNAKTSPSVVLYIKGEVKAPAAPAK
ncbi:MAG: DUF1573 domain-containing protein [Prevotellaceae bacterium]|jgi:hypothetical protein|nr:DUF1573 domain-containing protein [Prevotellaceae bacterium]